MSKEKFEFIGIWPYMKEFPFTGERPSRRERRSFERFMKKELRKAISDGSALEISPEISEKLHIISAVMLGCGVVPDMFDAHINDPDEADACSDIYVSWDDYTMDKANEIWQRLEPQLGPNFNAVIEVDCIIIIHDDRPD